MLQGDDPDREWTMFVIGQYVSLIYGILGALVSICWIVQIYFYCIADTPQLLGLNRVFVMKDDQNFFLSFFSLVLLAFFSFHLTLCCNQGLFSLGMFFPCLPVSGLLCLGLRRADALDSECRSILPTVVVRRSIRSLLAAP